MRLKKDKWASLQIGNIVSELRNSSNNPIKDGFEKYVGFEHIEPENIYLKQFGDLNDGVSFKKTFQKHDVLFGKIRAYLKKVAVAPIDGICSGDILVLRTKDENKLSQELLVYFLTTESFLKRAVDSSIGTTLPRTKWQHLSKHEISLPPLEEQRQIATLFQSIETAMEQVDEQEKNLKALWKRLIDEFVSDKPRFGNLLKGKKLKTYNYCDVTEKLMRKIDPLAYGIERIVAGENLESEDFKIRTWQKVGEGYLGPAFHVFFKAGDILYGSRRTYLKKVAYADFDGVCANTTYVIRANEKLLLQGLLKHLMLSERFTQYSIGVSKGSTNPYINWKDLDNFSFQIPDLETQKSISSVLDNILAIVEQLKQQKATLKNLKQKLLNEILG
jgi:type I restriction enzyme, S subunit